MAKLFAKREEKQIPRCARDDRWVDLVPMGGPQAHVTL